MSESSENGILFWSLRLLLCIHKVHLLFWKKRHLNITDGHKEKSLVTHSPSSCNDTAVPLHTSFCVLFSFQSHWFYNSEDRNGLCKGKRLPAWVMRVLRSPSGTEANILLSLWWGTLAFYTLKGVFPHTFHFYLLWV